MLLGREFHSFGAAVQKARSQNVLCAVCGTTKRVMSLLDSRPCSVLHFIFSISQTYFGPMPWMHLNTMVINALVQDMRRCDRNSVNYTAHVQPYFALVEVVQGVFRALQQVTRFHSQCMMLQIHVVDF